MPTLCKNVRNKLILAPTVFYVGSNGSGGYYADLLQNKNTSERDTQYFTCSTNLKATHPQWEINGVVYEVTDLPPNFSVNGLSIALLQQRFKIRMIRCILNLYLDGSVVNIYSNTISVTKETCSGQFDFTLFTKQKYCLFMVFWKSHFTVTFIIMALYVAM